MKKPVRCPLCESEMGRIESPKDAWFCKECVTYTDNSGKVITIDEKGKKEEVAVVRDTANNPDNKPERKEAKSYDAYFVSKDKRRFCGIVGLGHDRGWMIMTTRQGKEVLINAENCNFIEEV